MFRSVRGSDSCYIGNQSLYFRYMTPSKNISFQEGVPTSQSSYPTTKRAWINWSKTQRQKHLQNSTFCSVRGSDRCHIGDQPLYFHYTALSKLIRAQEGVPIAQSGTSSTKVAWICKKKHSAKINTKIARSALSGDPTAFTLVTNHSIFIKWP